MTTPSQAATAQAAAINGTAPADPAAGEAEECETCVTTGQKGLAVVVGLIGAAVLIMAIDVGTGYRLSRAFGFGPKEQTGSEPISGD